MSEQEKAREIARLILAWADEKTLQQLLDDGKWDDYTIRGVPEIYDPSCWRVKPEPRRMWTSHISVTSCAEQAAVWKARGYTVTEWMEVLP